MRKLFVFLATFFLLFGITVSAYALQYASSYSSVDLNSLSYTGKAYWGSLGVVTTGVAVANGESDSYAGIDVYGTLNIWADAVANGAYAETGYNDGLLYSEAVAQAGDAYGTESQALAGSVAMAYSIYVAAGQTVTINMNYFLTGDIQSDTDDGYSMAGSAALLAVLSLGDYDDDGDWQYISSDSEENTYTVDDLLTVTLTGGDTGSSYVLFAGTAAQAYAAETSAAPVPEPATMLLLGTGMLGLAGMSRRKLFKK